MSQPHFASLQRHFQKAGFLFFVAAFCVGQAWSASGPSPEFSAGVIVGTNENPLVWEASGLVASRQNAGVLWTHNDSGYRGSVFALSTNGAALGRYFIPEVYSGDFEDIALGPGPQPQFQYLYLGDIGDNFAARETIRVLRFPEPAAYAFQSNAPVEVSLTGAEEIVLAYPNGPFNAEGMMVDPWNGDLFIVTKQTNECRVFRATQAEINQGGTVPLTLVATPAFRSASAADISADGKLIAIRRPGRGGLWVRSPGQSVGDALKVAPITIPVIGQPSEPNGESFAFHRDAHGYYTISEGVTQPIYFFPRTDALPASPRVLVASGAEWNVNDFGEPLPSDWTTNLVEESFVVTAPIGSGGGERSTLESRVPTSYFFRRFTNQLAPGSLMLSASFRDGMAVYLNGTEIFRRHLVPGAAFDDFAFGSNADEARSWFSVPVQASLLRPGTNILAAEVHRFEPEGPNLLFDLRLLEGSASFPATLTSMSLLDGVSVGTIQGADGLVVPLERSNDLGSWSPASAVLLTNGLGTFAEPATNAARFYRLRPATGD
jgi:hypothetical protein